MGTKKTFENFVGNGETVSVDWCAARHSRIGIDVPEVVHVFADSGSFRFCITLSPETAEQMAAALIEAACLARDASLVEEAVPA